MEFSFKIDIPGTGLVDVFPKYDTLELIDTKTKRLYPRTVNTSFVFVDDVHAGINDFSRLYNLERTENTPRKIPFIIAAVCDCNAPAPVDYPEMWTGYLNLSKGEWDVSGCQVKIKPEPDTLEQCLLDAFKKDENLFDTPGDRIVAKPYYGVIQTKCCGDIDVDPPGWQGHEIFLPFLELPDYYNSSCLTDPETWSVLNHGIWVQGSDFNTFAWFKTCWAREYVAGGAQPPGDGWVQVEGENWARPVPTVFIDIVRSGIGLTEENAIIAAFFEREEYVSVNNDVLYRRRVLGDNNGTFAFGNGISFNDALEWIIAEHCEGLTVVSDFLGINPDMTAPDNEYYQKAAEDYRNMVIFQISDIAILDETQSATVATSNLGKILSFLSNLNVDLGVMPDGTVRLEHDSYWEQSSALTLDLTTPQLEMWIEGKFQYNYLSGTQRPRREYFRWHAETDKEGADFDGKPISYEDVSNIDPNEDDGGNRADGFYTNIQFLHGNEDHERDLELLVVALDQYDVIIRRTCPLSGTARINGALAISYILPNYMTSGRPYWKGYINDVLTILKSAQRTRKQREITIPFDCSDYLTAYNPRDYIKTQMGWGQVERASYKYPDETLSFITLHKSMI